MGFVGLLSSQAAIEAFKARFHILKDVLIKYCPQGDIESKREPRVIFIPLMALLEGGGGVRFPLDPLLLSTLRFYDLSPDQCHPIFYWVFQLRWSAK